MKVEAAIETTKRAVKAENRAPEWVMPVTKAAVFASDAVLATVCFTLAFQLRTGEQVLSPTAWAWSREFVPYAGIMFFAVPLRLAMLLYERSYRFSGAFSYYAGSDKDLQGRCGKFTADGGVGVSFQRRFRVPGIFLFARRFCTGFSTGDGRFRSVSSRAAVCSIGVSKTGDQPAPDTGRRDECRGRADDSRTSRMPGTRLSRDRGRRKRCR